LNSWNLSKATCTAQDDEEEEVQEEATKKQKKNKKQKKKTKTKREAPTPPIPAPAPAPPPSKGKILRNAGYNHSPADITQQTKISFAPVAKITRTYSFAATMTPEIRQALDALPCKYLKYDTTHNTGVAVFNNAISLRSASKKLPGIVTPVYNFDSYVLNAPTSDLPEYVIERGIAPSRKKSTDGKASKGVVPGLLE
jgi:hypothetical protein